MKANTDRKLVTLLFNPFVYIAGAKALWLGLAAILVSAAIGYSSHTHFDGVLDIHTGAPAPLWFFLAEGIVDWLCLWLVLLILGRIISRSAFRTIDLLGTQALARWPLLIFSLLALLKGYQRFSRSLLEQFTKPGVKLEYDTGDAVVFFVVIGAMIVLLCWMVALMYKSFSVSCNVRGAKAIWSFIGGIISGEVLSKVALYGLLKVI